MDTIMATGTFRLKGHQLYARGYSDRRVRNIQEVANRSGMSYPTAYKWVEKPHELGSISLENLAGFLIDGLGLKPEEVATLNFGDVFEFVPQDKKDAGAE